MKKGILAFIVIIILVGYKFSFSDDYLFSIKLSGGISRVSTGGNLKSWFNGEKAYFEWLGNQPNYSSKSSYPFKQDEPEGSFEVIFRPLKNVGMGIGLGYMRRGWDSSAELTYYYGDALGSERIEISSKTDINVFPITLSVIFSVPYKFLKGNLFAGGGIYYANVKFDMDSIYSWPKFPDKENYRHNYSSQLTTHSEGVGFHGGIGLEIKVFSHLSISIDALMRSVKLGDIKGELKWNEIVEWSGYKSENSGAEKDMTLWFGSFKVGSNQFERAIFSAEKPSFFEGARPFKFNFDGFYLKAGIIFSF